MNIDTEEKMDEIQQETRKKLAALEEAWEDYQRKKKRFEQEKEDAYIGMAEDQAMVQELIETWGSSTDSNIVYTILDETLAEEKKELQQIEEQLEEEGRRIRQEQRACEELCREQFMYRDEEESKDENRDTD